MTTKPLISLEHPFLRALVPEHRSIALQGAEEKVFAQGEVLFREGQPASRFFLIHEGYVALETHIPGHGDVTIMTLGPGQALGWSWLVAPFVWHFQARAVELAKVTVLNGAHLLVASELNHFLGYELMKSISKLILEVVLATHQRLVDAGHHPSIPKPASSQTKSAPPALPLGTRLTDHPFFHGLSPDHLKVFVELARPTEFEPEQIVFETGDPASALYVIERGHVLLTARQGSETVPVQVIGGGDAVGWSSFCEPYRWCFDGRAVEPTSTICFSAADLRERCARDYHLGFELNKRITRLMLQRLQATRNRMWESMR
jgi:CRP/FNR family cyclic AMP-dependent transcriptional regulator